MENKTVQSKPAGPPVTIWLQWYGDAEPDESGQRSHDEISCSVNKIFKHDTKYIQAEGNDRLVAIQKRNEDKWESSLRFLAHQDDDFIKKAMWLTPAEARRAIKEITLLREKTREVTRQADARTFEIDRLEAINRNLENRMDTICSIAEIGIVALKGRRR